MTRAVVFALIAAVAAPAAAQSGGLPDLVGTSLVASPVAVMPGGMISVTDQVVARDADAGPFAVLVCVSPDPWFASNYACGRRRVTGLTAGASSSGTTELRVPIVPPGRLYVAAAVDYDHEVAESNEYNNGFVGESAQVMSPDLVVISSTASQTTAVPGERITFTTTVAALDGDVGPFTGYLCPSVTPVIELSGLCIPWHVDGLAAGQTVTTTVQGIVQNSLGTFYYGAIVDGDHAIVESNEDNNALLGGSILVQGAPPDLTVTAVSASPAALGAGGTLVITDTVWAQGGAVGSFTVQVCVSRDAIITTSDTCTRRSVAGLADGAASTTTTSLVIGALPAGTYYVGAIVDADGWVSESDEANNVLIASGTVTIGVPDLVPTSVTVSGSSVAAGGILDFADTVQALHGSTATFDVALCLSIDSEITTDDLCVFRTVGGLTAGASSTGSATMRVPATLAGEFHYGVIADARSGVAETSEGNNTLVGAGTVTVVPDTTPPSISVSGVADGDVSRESPLFVCWEAADPNLAGIDATLDGVAVSGNCTSVLLSGEHELVVQASDLAGNVATRSIGFALDFEPPVPAISGVFDGLVSRLEVVPIYTASDAHLESVTGQMDGAPFASGTVVTAEGEHTLVVTATDRAGHVTTATVMFALDRIAPTLTVGGVFSGQVTRSAVAPTFTATDPHPGAISATLDGQPFMSGAAVDVAGEHQLVVTATDRAGNTSNQVVAFSIDRTAPTVAIGAPADGTAVSGTGIEVVATASDAHGVAQVRANDVALAPAGDGSWHGTVQLIEGSNAIAVVATDDAGNDAVATVSVQRDSQPPELQVTAPAEGASLSSSDIAVSGRVTDAHAVTVRVNGEVIAVAADGAFATVVHGAPGARVIEIAASDAVGNSTTAVRHVDVSGGAPTLVIAEPVPGFVATQSPLMLRGSATSGDGGPISLTVNGITFVVSSDGTFSGTVPVSAGAVSLSFVAVGSGGLTRQVTVTGSYSPVDPAGPTGPTGASGPAGPTGATGTTGPSGPPLALSVSSPMDQAVSGLGTVAVEGRVEGGTPPYQVKAAGVSALVSGGSFSVALPLAEGDNTVQIRATDAGGRVATVTRVVSVDHTPPYLAITRPPTASAEVSESPYLLEGTVGDAHLARVSVAGIDATVIGGQFSVPVALQAGDNNIGIVATDLVGNATTRTVNLHVAALPPRVTILEPGDGAEASGTFVHVRARVDGTSAIQSVMVGTGSAQLQGGEWVADFALELKPENTIVVRATDAAGQTGTATARVRYRDQTQEPLAVVGVDPAPGATGVDPSSLVTVSFNKPVARDGVAAAFTVAANGAAVPGGYYIAPGGQLVSFVAKQALPTGQRLTVRVSALAAGAGPGLGSDFTSDFTVRRPRRHVMGNVVDPAFQPVPGARVEIEGTPLSAQTSPDGSWVITEAPAGDAVIRIQGGPLPDGGSLPVVRRRIYVDGAADTHDPLLVLTPTDPLAFARIDGAVASHVDFGPRVAGLVLDLPANGALFEDGRTQGFVTATEVQPWACPVPSDSAMALGGLWQVQPAGIRVAQPIDISMPNRAGLPPGRYAVALTYDPGRHMLRRAGLVRTSDDGKVIRTVEPVVASGLDFFGLALLSDEQHQVVLDVLSGKTPAPPPAASPSGKGASRSVWSRAKLAMFDLFLMTIGGEAHAQLGVGGPFGIGGYGLGWAGIDVYGSPGMHWVGGRVRSPQDVQVDIQVVQGELNGSELVVSLPYQHPVRFDVFSDDYDAHGTSTITARMRANAATATRGTDPNGATTYVSRAEIQPPPGEEEKWGTAAQPRTGQGSITIQSSVPLDLGTTLITVEGMQARATGSTATRTRRLVAQLTPLPNADGSTDAAPKQARLVITRADEPIDRAFSYDAGGIHYDTGGTTFFRNWPITVNGRNAAVTGPSGSFSAGVFAYGRSSSGTICTEIDAGVRWTAFVDTTVPDKPRIAYDWYRTGYPICMSGGTPAGGSSRVQLVVDARLLFGDITFYNRDERRVACEPDAQTTWNSETSELDVISPADVSMTEVYFFREDDLSQAIAKYVVAAPDLDSTNAPTCGTSGRHARYARLRLGPADRTTRRVREWCDYLKSQNRTDDPFYKSDCSTKQRVNALRLSAGDRLVVVGVNHATGYAGMSTVTVPAVQQVNGDPDGSCPADTAAGGPVTFDDYGQTLTVSRCAQQDITVRADLRLYPPEVDIRVARQMRQEGAAADEEVHLVRHGGAATTRDELLQVSSHWRVRLPPSDPIPGDMQYAEWLAHHSGTPTLAPGDRREVEWIGDENSPGPLVDYSDRDGDGVPDSVDRCPDLAGVVAAKGCPSWMDSDGDQIVDTVDMCPTEPGPADSPVGMGCPDPARPDWRPAATGDAKTDTDLDNVNDADDRCPLHQGPEWNNGCPVLTVGFDLDQDGVPDADDACIMMPGPPSTNGCPDAGYSTWTPPGHQPPRVGEPGRLLERLCTEMQSPSADQLKICKKLEARLVDMPAGVPPLAAHLVSLPGGAAVAGSDKPFPILPGAHTNNVQAAFRAVSPGGADVKEVRNLARANYYVHVVGNMVLINDRNMDWSIDPVSEIAIAPPAFAGPVAAPASYPEGLPERAIPVKAVYRSHERDQTLVERYDRAREHEFRVVELDVTRKEANEGGGQRRDLPSPDPSSGVAAHSADRGDLSYEMLFSLLQPTDAGRTSTFPGDYGAKGEVHVRLGTDAYGIECEVDTTDLQNAKATCDGAYLYDVLSARDIVYLGIYLSGNAENFLYRYNLHGLAPRSDLVTAGHVTTTMQAVLPDQANGPAPERPISRPALANVFVEPSRYRVARVDFCLDDCEGDNLLKRVRLERQADATYTMTEEGGRPHYARPEKVDKVGLGNATLLRLQLPPEATAMPGSASTVVPKKVEARLEELDPSSEARSEVIALGQPQGDYQGTNARAPGQAETGGVSLADGHLAFRHEDFSLPEYASAVRFSRTYNNTDNEPGTLGTGWRHSYEAFVVEEKLGRYSMVLEGQSYDFPSCATVDDVKKTAEGCQTDLSHGGLLKVSQFPDGAPKVEFVAADGKRYRFDRWAQGSLQVTGVSDGKVSHSRRQIREAGRRRWLLTAFEDGHGAYDAGGAQPEQPGDRWTLLEYVPDSDLVSRVYRKGGKLELVLSYVPVPVEYPSRYRALAVAEGFALLDTVVARFQGQDAGAFIRKLQFSRKPVGSRAAGPDVGNLTEVTRLNQDPAGSTAGREDQRWVYGYVSNPRTEFAKDAPLRASALWAATNELEVAELKLYGSVQARSRWSRDVHRTWEGLSFQKARPFEIIDDVVLPGTSAVGPDSTTGERPLHISWDSDFERTVSRADGTTVKVTVNRYGNVSAEKVADASAANMDWLSKDLGKPVTPQTATSPTGRETGFAVDERLRPLSVTAAKAGVLDSHPTRGAEPGTALVSIRPTDIQDRFGIPMAATLAGPAGPYVVATGIASSGTAQAPTGDVNSLTVTEGSETLLAWKGDQHDSDGVLQQETDAVGRTIAYSEPGIWGQMAKATITYSDAAQGGRAKLTRTTAWDSFGRVAAVSDDAGHREEWVYDEAGRLLEHVVSGTPAAHWRYSYVGGTGDEPVLTVTEHLDGTAHERVRIFRDGQLVKEAFKYGDPQAPAPLPRERIGERTFAYDGGRMTRANDDRGVTREYHYDSKGRLEWIEAKEGSSAGGVEEVRYTRDDEGRVTKQVDRDGLAITTEFDRLGRPVRWDYQGVGFAGKDIETVVLDPNGVVVERTNGSYTWLTDTDALGRVRAIRGQGQRAAELSTHTDYDAAGRKTHAIDSVLELEEWWEYRDVLGRLTEYRRTVRPAAGTYKETRAYVDSGGDGPSPNATTTHSVTIQQEVGGVATRKQELTLDDAGRVLLQVDYVPGELSPGGGARGQERRSERTFDYDARGNVVRETYAVNDSALAASQTRGYDAAGYLVWREEPADIGEGSARSAFATDAAGLVIEKLGPISADHWTYSYDLFGRPLTKKLLQGGTSSKAWSYAYAPLDEGATAAETDPDGYTTNRWLNARGKVLKEIRKDEGGGRSSGNRRVLQNTYDGPWVSVQTITEGAWTSTIERPIRDLRGRVQREIERFTAPGAEAYEYTTSTSWTGRSANVTQSWAVGAYSGSRGGTTEVDSLEHVISRKWGAHEDTFTYDAAGQKLAERLAGQPVREFRYTQELLVEVVFGTGATERTLYDYWLSGKPHRVVDPAGRTRETTWTPRGLLQEERFGWAPETEVKTFTYDALGHVQTLTVGGSTWAYDTGPEGELLKVRQPGGLGEFEYAYDGRLNLIRVSPPAGGSAVQTFQYDYLGRAVHRTRGTAVWTTVWTEGTGTTTDPTSRMLTRTLDGRGREVRARYSGAASDLIGVDSSYGIVDEPLAKVEQRASVTVTEAYGYVGEADRRLVTSIRRGTQVVAYGYSPSGRRSSVTTAGGQVEYEYDNAYDRLARIRRNTEVGTAITWEPGGERITELLGGGLRECRTYWGQGWLKQLSSVDAGANCESPTPHERYVYQYDGRGNRTAEERTVGAVTRTLGYGYDDADRLTGVQYEDGSAALYQIGGDGSRTGEKQVDAYAGPLGPEGYAGALGVVEKTYRYDARGGLADTLDGGSTLVHYAVDDAGRVLSEQRAGLVRQYGWDASGRLSSIQVSQTAGGAVDTTTYRYDHAGRRIEKHGPPGDQAYIWGGSELHEETTASGARMVYERAGDLVVAVNGERVLHDGLGSVTGRLSTSGTITGFRYDAWGGFRSATSGPGASEPSLAYAGQHWDADAGLSYAQQRWYEPRSGRFLSEDPVGWNAERLSQPTRGHAFGYAAGNPLLFTDPEGLDVGQPESTTRRAQEDMSYEAARNEWSKDEGNWVTGCLAAEADNWRHIDSAAFNARSKSPGWLAGYMKCQGRPVADAWHDSDIGKTTREFWTATPGRSGTMGCFIGGVNAITPVGGGDVNDLPASMQQSAGMCQFAVGGATLGVMLIEQGPGALQKLKDASKALKNEPALAAVTADGRTVAMAGEEVSAGERMPTRFEARAKAGEGGASGGKGLYKDAGGHHVHAKSGFRDHLSYDPDRGFSISQEYMKKRGWSHEDMSAAQRKLFDELADSGRQNTLREHTRVAVEALKAGGATEQEARALVAESLRNLREQRVRAPTRVPWNE